MNARITLMALVFTAAMGVFAWFLGQGIAHAHCDTLDGPVVKTAELALEKGDVTPTLKWVKEKDEEEVHTAFQKTMAVRTMGPEAKELAEWYFLETLVRIHRTGERAPYTGLKPAGAVDRAVAEADKALESGSVEELVKLVTDAVAYGIREQFALAAEAQRHSEESIEAGREFVEAYVEFTHYVERLHSLATCPPAHYGEGEGKGPEHPHEH